MLGSMDLCPVCGFRALFDAGVLRVGSQVGGARSWEDAMVGGNLAFEARRFMRMAHKGRGARTR